MAGPGVISTHRQDQTPSCTSSQCVLSLSHQKHTFRSEFNVNGARTTPEVRLVHCIGSVLDLESVDTWPYSFCEYCYQDTVEPK